jgi:tetratricopeptide (TPR) repeat protein
MMFPSRRSNPMKLSFRNYCLTVVWLTIFFSGCGGTGFQGGSDVAQGRQALFRGDYPTALDHFRSAENAGPNYVFGTELREGVLSFLGRAQYLNGQLPQARTTLQQALAQHKSDNAARLYLGLTLARENDRKAAVADIESGLKGMRELINYIANTSSNSFGSFWDSNGSLRKSITANLTMVAGGNFDWPTLIANCETVAMNYEQVEDRANQDQRQFIEMNQP